jgi:hypothetical protein
LIELAVIIPTFNERDNVEPLLAKLDRALDGVSSMTIRATERLRLFAI